MLSLVILFAPSGDGAAPFRHSDKLVHAGLFLLLAASARWRFGPVAVVLAAVCLYAPFSEVVQATLLPDRDGDWHDAAADLLGAVLGWLGASRLLARQALHR